MERGTRTILAAAAAFGALACATPAAAEVVETRADGFTTRASAAIAEPPMEVWLALTKPGEWWNDDHTWSGDAANMTLTPQAGGCFCEKVPGGDTAGGFAMDGSATHATVVLANPLKVLRMRGGLGPLQSEPATGVLTITMEAIDGGTQVFWEYNVGGPMRYPIDTISKAVDGVMSQQLTGLQSHLGALAGDTVYEGPDSDSEPANESEESSGDSEEPSVEDQIDALRGND